jgi:hypothetical protein
MSFLSDTGYEISSQGMKYHPLEKWRKGLVFKEIDKKVKKQGMKYHPLAVERCSPQTFLPIA